MKTWLHQIGQAPDNKCLCGGPQNAAHLLSCKLVGDGKGMNTEQIEEYQEWCEAVYSFWTGI